MEQVLLLLSPLLEPKNLPKANTPSELYIGYI